VSGLFATEAALCAAFIADATESGDWIAYPETAAFDILLVRKSDGVQIGIEAKLVLNTKVLSQALPQALHHTAAVSGPDYRAVLVPADKAGSLETICAALGITVIRYRGKPEKGSYDYAWKAAHPFHPSLPVTAERYRRDEWHEWAPMERCALPDYIPDAVAGSSSPIRLTDWKVKAIKMSVLLETRPVTRADFKALGMDPGRWTDPYTKWLVATPEGYVAGPGLPNFARQHPRNYAEVKADAAALIAKIDAAVALLPKRKKAA
jgi:hypothetical protein